MTNNRNDLPLLLKKIQTVKKINKELHIVPSKILQTAKHTVRDLVLRTSYFPEQYEQQSNNVSNI